MTQTETARISVLRSELILQVRRMSRDHGLAVARTFYAELFSRCPSLRKHFAGIDVDTQAAKLWNVMRLVVASDSNVESLHRATMQVARRHHARGVEPSHYALFTAVLADVLACSQRAVPFDEAKQLWSSELEKLTALIEVLHEATA